MHNNQRDGMHRQAIHRGRVAYEPNSLGGGCPFQAGAAGFVSFPEPMRADDHKVRGKPERFADHYTQATLFWNSQTPVEQTHIVNAFRFELSKVQTPAIRERMVSGLMNVAPELAEAVADGLGMREMPEPMPKVLQNDGDAGGRRRRRRCRCSRGRATAASATRRVAILVADGVDGDAAAGACRAPGRGRRGAALRRRRGSARSRAATGEPIEVDAPLEATPSVLFDAVVVPDGDGAVEALRGRRPRARVREGPVPPLQADPAARRRRRTAARRPAFRDALPSGEPDPGLLVGTAGDGDQRPTPSSRRSRKHRHFERETDPPRV